MTTTQFDAGATPAAAGQEVNRWVTACAVMFGSFMVFLDTSIVNLSLPHMAGSLSASVSEATWALTSYLAANAVILPMTGWLANNFGRKRLILMAMGGFTLASLACGLAPNLESLVVFRILQGLTGGVLQPLSMSVLLESFPREERGKAMGFWSTGIVLAPILGPVLGGYITDEYSWRWVFLINIPVGVLAIVMVQLYVFDPSYVSRRASRVDVLGIIAMALGIASLQVLLDIGQDEEWFASNRIRALFVVGLVATAVFLIQELHTREPIVDLEVFRVRTFAIGSVISAVVGFLLFGSMVLMPLLLQTMLGYPPLDAGLALAPRGIGAFFSFPVVGILTHRVDPRALLALGLVLISGTMFWFAGLSQDLGYWDLVAPQVIQGIALGLLFVPLSTMTMDPIPLHKMGNATSVNNTLRNFGSSVGIGVVATYLARTQYAQARHLSEYVTEYDLLSGLRFDLFRDAFAASGSDPFSATQQAAAALGGLVEYQAGILSYLGCFRLLGWLAMAMIPLVVLMKKPGGDIEGAHPPELG